MPSTPSNTLFYGDNLEVLREYIASESVDLIYLDPPFNSKRDYNILFKESSGEAPVSQIKAFGDSWQYAEEVEKTLAEISEVALQYRCPKHQAGKNPIYNETVLVFDQNLAFLQRSDSLIHCFVRTERTGTTRSLAQKV